MIRAQDITIRRGGRILVDKVSLHLDAGKVTVIIGPNGAGKSTLLKTLCGELRPDAGEVFYHDRRIASLDPISLARERAVLPQSTTLSFPFTALEVVRMGAVAHGSRDPNLAGRQALVRVGLGGFEGRSYNALSGGEQQRVQLARVLAQMPEPVMDDRPRAIFLDEPTASLDIGHQISVLELARDFARRGGVVLAILHDLNLAAEFADHLAVLHHGKLIREGHPKETIDDETIAHVYGIAGSVGRLPSAAIPYVLPQARFSATR
ncbi:MAG: heme ABC transporter ATP-binding protein [Rhizobium sp.]|nr:heme ABC transporter ATP-binding protein [Rhizobium sp.]